MTVLALAGCLQGPAGDDASADGGGPVDVTGNATQSRNILILGNATGGALGAPVRFALNDVGVGAPEPTLGVTSTGSVFYIAGTSVLKSTDHGLSWTNVAPQVGPTNVPPTTLDPMLYVDPVTDRVFYDHLYLACSYMAYSDDEGETWIPNPATCGVPGIDHQSLSSGPSVLPAPVYDDRAVYFCANQLADATCAVSLDGGATFPITRPVFRADDPRSCGGIHGHVVIGPEGNVYLPAWHCDEPWIGISRDGGLSWEAFRVAPGVSSGEMDPSVAVATDGSVYYFWMDLEGQPYLAVSEDEGRTWSEPTDVSFPGLTVANLPSIVAGDAGRVAFTYIGTTDGEPVNPGAVDEKTTWHLYVTMSTNALDPDPRFTTVRLTTDDAPIHVGACSGGYRCGAIVDFMDIAMGPDGRVYSSSTASATSGNGVIGVQVAGPSLLEAEGILAPPAGYA
jgi:hypothetical protein